MSLFKIISLSIGLSLSSLALGAAPCSLEVQSGVDSTGKSNPMAFNTKSIEIPKTCKEFKITLVNKTPLPKAAFGHNLVISSEKDMQKVIGDGGTAGLASEFLKKGSPYLFATKLLGPNEKDTVTVKVASLKAGTKYVFFCTFPGHSAMMKGDIVLK